MVTQAKVSIQNDKIISNPTPKFPFTKGIGRTIYEKLTEAYGAAAQIDADNDKIDTYEEFTKRCIRTAITMRSKGITSGDVITICSSNHLNVCVPIISSFFLDVKMANTDPSLSLNDTSYLLNQVRPKMIFVSPNAIKLIEDAIKIIGLNAEIVVFGKTAQHIPFSTFLFPSEEEVAFKPVEVTDLKKTAAMFFSSGTTGIPKAICLNHKSLLSQCVVLPAMYKLPETVILTNSPAYWISLTYILLLSIFNKSCRVVTYELNPDTTLKLIEKYKVTVMVLSPNKVAQICQFEPPQNVDISSVRVLGFGGTTFSEEMMKKIRNILPKAYVFTGYGQTEIGIATSFQIESEEELELALTKIKSSGKVSPGYTIKVVDIETEEVLGPNQEGEIRVKTNYAMNGYYGMDSSDQWDEDGFIKTGDLGYYDEDKYFYITDRIKEMLKYQCMQIAPVKIESILMTHPAVLSAMVIGIPHPLDIEHPMGLVIVKKTHLGTVTENEIKQYVDDKVDNLYKLRAGVKFVESFNMTPSDKYKRKYMKELVLTGQI